MPRKPAVVEPTHVRPDQDDSIDEVGSMLLEDSMSNQLDDDLGKVLSREAIAEVSQRPFNSGMFNKQLPELPEVVFEKGKMLGVGVKRSALTKSRATNALKDKISSANAKKANLTGNITKKSHQLFGTMNREIAQPIL